MLIKNYSEKLNFFFLLKIKDRYLSKYLISCRGAFFKYFYLIIWNLQWR